MKKFFRMVSMFVLAGATLAYTGCTDYDEDIEAINDRIDKLETGKLKTVEEQISSLSASVTDLQAAKAKTESAIEALQSALSDLQTKHNADIKALEEAYNAADKNLQTSIENQIKTLTDQFNAKVTEINTAISGLQSSVNGINTKISGIEDTIKTLATKEYVDATFATKKYAEATFATKEEVKKVEEELGKLSARLEIAEKAISTIQGQISDLQEADKKLDEAVKAAQKAADDAQTAADKAQGTAEAALSTANALVEALGAYSVQGALEAKIAALMAMDHELDSTKFNTADFHDTFTTEFNTAIEAALANGGVINEEIASQVKTAREALEKKIDDVKKALDARIDKVLGVIEGRLTSIAFVPQYYYEGVPAILFETIAYDALEDGKDHENDTPKVYDDANNANLYKYFATALATAKYRLNPRTVGADCADFSFVGEKAEYITRATAPAAPVSVSGTPSYDAKTGYVTFQVEKKEKLNTTDKLDIVALKAVLKKGLTESESAADEKPEVYSEYVHVREVAVPSTVLALSDKAILYNPTKPNDPAGLVRGNFEYVNGHEYANTFKAATEGGVVYEMPYNKNFDLKALVATCQQTIVANGTFHGPLDLGKFGFTYRFSVAQSDYIIPSDETKTNQQTVIQCVDAEKGIFKTIDAQGVENNKEAIGRTPIVRVDLMHVDENGKKHIVTRAFIKLLISVEKEENIRVADTVKTVILACPEDVVKREINEETMREAVYRVMNISHEEFWSIYGGNPTTKVTVDGKESTTVPAPQLLDGIGSDGKATKKVVWSMTHAQAGKIGKGKKIVAELTVHNQLFSSERPAEITFVFEVNFKLPDVEKDVVEKPESFWKEGVLQANVNVPSSIDDSADNCWFETPIENQPWEKHIFKNLPCDAKPYLKITKLYKNGKEEAWKANSGVELGTFNGETSIKLDKNNAAIKAALNSAKGLQAEVKWVATAASGDEIDLNTTFLVNFKRPLTFNLPPKGRLEVNDAVTGGAEVNFQDIATLIDWRGELVFAPGTKNVSSIEKYWVKDCVEDHMQYVPEYQIVKTPAKFEFQTQEVKIAKNEIVYVASYQLWTNDVLIKWYDALNSKGRKGGKDDKDDPDIKLGWAKSQIITAQGRSANEARQAAEAKINALDIHYLDGYYSCGRAAEWLGAEPVVTTTETTITVIENVIYTPAVYETVEGYWVINDCTAKPESTDYPVGTREGCWKLCERPSIEEVPVSGQYWDFYGEIGSVVLDTKNVSTSRYDGLLPANASIEQDGTVLKYMNVQSPIQEPYYMYIPATITYGWGTLTSTLIIKVNPVATIAQ